MTYSQIHFLSTSVFVPHQEEQPPSGTCAFQEKIKSGLWKCYSEAEYAQKKTNERIEQEKCIASSPMPNSPEFTNLLGVIIIIVTAIILLYLTEMKKWWRGLFSIAILGCIYYFLKPFC